MPMASSSAKRLIPGVEVHVIERGQKVLNFPGQLRVGSPVISQNLPRNPPIRRQRRFLTQLSKQRPDKLLGFPGVLSQQGLKISR